MPRWLETVLGLVAAALVGFFSTKLPDWLRFRRKDKVDVQKVQQDIKLDQVEAANSIVKSASDYTNLVMANLDKTEKRLEVLAEENRKKDLIIESLRGHISDVNRELKEVGEKLHNTKNKMQELLDELAECLKVKDCASSLQKIRDKFGLK